MTAGLLVHDGPPEMLLQPARTYPSLARDSATVNLATELDFSNLPRMDA